MQPVHYVSLGDHNRILHAKTPILARNRPARPVYPSLAQRVTHHEVLRVVLSLGATEAMHFQTWHDKAGNAPPLTNPTNGLTFPDLSGGGELFQANLIMPGPCPFLSKDLPSVSIIWPTET